jgi:hypothetical protein
MLETLALKGQTLARPSFSSHQSQRWLLLHERAHNFIVLANVHFCHKKKRGREILLLSLRNHIERLKRFIYLPLYLYESYIGAKISLRDQPGN